MHQLTSTPETSPEQLGKGQEAVTQNKEALFSFSVHTLREIRCLGTATAAVTVHSGQQLWRANFRKAGAACVQASPGATRSCKVEMTL